MYGVLLLKKLKDVIQVFEFYQVDVYMYGFFKGKRQTKVSTKAATVLEAISLTDQPNRCWGHKHCIE